MSNADDGDGGQVEGFIVHKGDGPQFEGDDGELHYRKIV